MCSKWAQHIFWIRFRRADDSAACAHRLITGLLPAQRCVVAAERLLRSGGYRTRRISYGWRTREIICMSPYKRMTACKQTCIENFQLYDWRGGVFIEILPGPREDLMQVQTVACMSLKWHARRSWCGSLSHANPAFSDAVFLCVIPLSGIPTYWACCVIRSSCSWC